MNGEFANNVNQHCGKHDKIFSANNPCPGCQTEAEGGSTGGVVEESHGEEAEKDERHRITFHHGSGKRKRDE